MKAHHITHIEKITSGGAPLRQVEIPVPEPGPGQIRLKVLACGVCHTELDEIEGRTCPPEFPVVPGHEVIGKVDKLGPGAERFRKGDRLGVGWIFSSSGDVHENVSEQFVATGRDIDGGYAEYMIANENYAFLIPDRFSDAEAAPLMCAGGVGYRALRLTGISDSEYLGLTGFGGSAHIVLQMAKYLYPNLHIYVFARDAGQRQQALELGANWAGATEDSPPKPLHAIIDTTPAWTPIVAALEHLRPGGRLIINAIRKENQDREVLMNLDYGKHLWLEKEIKTVANVTADDIKQCLELAAKIPLRPTIQSYTFAEANRALSDLKTGQVRGAKVLLMDDT